jgi:hypothetical protein
MKKNDSFLGKILLTILIIVFSIVVVYASFYSSLQTALKPPVEITLENYGPEIKSKINSNDIISIKGTPDLLVQVSQEPLESSTDQIIYHYAGLKEYGFDFVVRIKRSKLESVSQTFTGRVVGINETDFKNRIRASLNKELSFNEQANRGFGLDLDENTKKQIIANSAGQFSNSALLILDGEVVSIDKVYNQIISNTIALSAILIAIFNKKIFY